MLSRAFARALVKGTRRPLVVSVQAPAALRHGCQMPQQLHRLHRRPVQPDGSQHPLQGTNTGVPAVAVFQPNLTKNRSFSSMVANSADASVNTATGDDTVGGNIDQRFATLTSIGDCVNQNELRLLLEKNSAPVCYVWCDPSPCMHITQGISVAMNVNKLIKAGCTVKVLMADWLARMDRKIGGQVGGDLGEMKTVGLYNAEVWKAAGMDLQKVELVWLSDGIIRNADVYWPLTMHIAIVSEVSGIKRWLRFRASKDTRGHGRKDPYSRRDFTAAEMFYPCLQSAGMLLFHEAADMWLLSLDQRGGHMVARQFCNDTGKRNIRPVALFNNVLPNLLESPETEMIDDPSWAIFMEDDEDDITWKMDKAFCPLDLAEVNPCLEYVEHIILPWLGKFEVVREEHDGGNKTFVSMEEFTSDYQSGALHPSDVKHALERSLNMVLQPIRDHFRDNAGAKKLVEAMEKYYSYFR
ncbi:tyrosine--tRNA ligase 1, cytoplasmic-like [Lolium rigidum]|uniref:tyrosine--tRNA ligase 1, cytoplasmic-like n=1 Tax=Lolium rigidum TaxID=89674 RepID=UPI001F5C8358|nr:tyrosine--tRNA ligase 1, cytoplasmic-like [Lolium rigidum]